MQKLVKSEKILSLLILVTNPIAGSRLKNFRILREKLMYRLVIRLKSMLRLWKMKTELRSFQKERQKNSELGRRSVRFSKRGVWYGG